MRVILERGQYHEVRLQNFDGTLVDLRISPKEALDLLHALSDKRAELHDMATNFYECPNCGETHPYTMQTCPAMYPDEEEKA